MRKPPPHRPADDATCAGSKATNKRPAARRNFVRYQPARPHCEVSAAGLSPPFGGAKSQRKLNMSWHHPDLYFFLCLLAGSLAAFLAIECIQTNLCRPKPPVVEPRRSVEPPSPPKHPPPPFSRLCESVEALPPKQQASRVA